jgi:hypothetical protein
MSTNSAIIKLTLSPRLSPFACVGAFVSAQHAVLAGGSGSVTFDLARATDEAGHDLVGLKDRSFTPRPIAAESLKTEKGQVEWILPRRLLETAFVKPGISISP